MAEIVTTFTYQPNSENVYPNKQELEICIINLLKLVLKDVNSPLQLTNDLVNKSIFLLDNENSEDVKTSEAVKNNQALVVFVGLDPNSNINQTYLQNKNSNNESDFLTIDVSIRFRIYKNLNEANVTYTGTPQNLLEVVVNYIKRSITRNYNSDEDGTSKFLQIDVNDVGERPSKSFQLNLGMGDILEETTILDESKAIQNKDLSYNFFFKEVTIRFTLLNIIQ